MYFGVGCYWHVQHEFTEAEKNILGRTSKDFTALTGYAGGTKVEEGKGLDGETIPKVCYHNTLSKADYGRLGHAEVVSLKVPPSSYK